MTLTPLPYSLLPFGFEQFEAIEGFEDCGEPAPAVLPVYAADDVAFQVRISGSAEEIAALCAGFKDIKLKLLNGCSYKTVDDYPDVIKTYTGIFKVWIRGTTEAILYWPHGLPGIDDDIQCDGCFQLAVLIGSVLYPSACLKRICDPCHTSLIEYYCEENAYGFQYCDTDILNRARVPVKLSKPQITDVAENIYTRSDGSVKVLSSVSKKEYELTVGFLTAKLHEGIKMALSHDFVWIRSKTYEGEIRKSGGYEIEWPDDPDYPDATAKTKVIVTPYDARNSNCAICEPVTECTDCSAVIGIVGTAQVDEDTPEECPEVTGMVYHFNTAGNPIITKIYLSPTPSADISCTVKFKVSSQADSTATVVNTGIMVEPNGDLNSIIPLEVTGMSYGVVYEIMIYAECDPDSIYREEVTGQNQNI